MKFYDSKLDYSYSKTLNKIKTKKSQTLTSKPVGEMQAPED